MGGRAPGEVSTALSMTECCLPRHRHAGKVRSAAQEPDTKEEAQSGPPPRKEGPVSDGQEGDGRGCWRPRMRGLGLRVTLAGPGRPLDTPPRLAASPAPHGTGLHPGGDTRSAQGLQGPVCGCVGWMRISEGFDLEEDPALC